MLLPNVRCLALFRCLSSLLPSQPAAAPEDWEAGGEPPVGPEGAARPCYGRFGGGAAPRCSFSFCSGALRVSRPLTLSRTPSAPEGAEREYPGLSLGGGSGRARVLLAEGWGLSLRRGRGWRQDGGGQRGAGARETSGVRRWRAGCDKGLPYYLTPFPPGD